ncbi:MAG: hypothetical protein IKY52_00665 [Clostridia bacterium]|nr:hypothetical protein [Clostridia bacterium]
MALQLGKQYFTEILSCRTDIDFVRLIPNINRRKYHLIGLTYNRISEEELFRTIRKYDTEDDWTYYLSDEQLKEYCGQYVSQNRFFDEKFREYSIPSYDTSTNREEVLNDIVEHLEDRCAWEPETIAM